jgi:hypothetical protein
MEEGDQSEYSYEHNCVPYHLALEPMGEPMCLLYGKDDPFPSTRDNETYIYSGEFHVKVYNDYPIEITVEASQPLPGKSMRKRSASDMEAYKEALYDSSIAFMVQYTTDGIKTRDRFHKRIKT